ncbi:MAG TPA: tRNA pseudouridine(13) synthase TruD [Deltaproteobacteria bacterium]|nr:tRNA pseudouridine(13) synthase TruD [Deltaproteobacteria bacterium]
MHGRGSGECMRGRIPIDRIGGARFAIRSVPEDFIVVEEPLYPPTGEGGHTFVRVEKRERTTEQVARDLARAAGVTAREVGMAGRKDRHAVTTQWFSLPAVEPARALDFELPEVRVLEAHRHPHKLKTGHLLRNRFEITLRDIRPPGGTGSSRVGEQEGGTGDGDDLDAIRRRAAELVERGMPNRYGEQRFGMRGTNVEEAKALLRTGPGRSRRPRSGDRRAARFLISALQSAVFNAVLEERGEDFDRVVLGDLARVEESGGLFWVDDPDRESPRARAFEISATGPIFGTRMRSPKGEVARLERAVFDRFGLPELPELVLPRGVRARGTRRPFRVRPIDLDVRALPEGGGIRVGCALPPGAYVTVLLEALVGPVLDLSQGRADRPRPPEASPAASPPDRVSGIRIPKGGRWSGGRC